MCQIAPGNGSVPDGTQSLPEPMLTHPQSVYAIHVRVTPKDVPVNLMRNILSQITLS